MEKGGSSRPSRRPNWHLSHRVVQILQSRNEGPDDLKYDIFFATSNNKSGYRDLEHAREVLGDVPHNSAEAFR